MKKYILDLVVTQNIKLHANYVLIKLTHANPLPEMLPGQFAEIRIDGSNTTFLRRPISINYVDKTTNEVWFLVQLVGDGTRKLATVNPGWFCSVSVRTFPGATGNTKLRLASSWNMSRLTTVIWSKFLPLALS